LPTALCRLPRGFAVGKAFADWVYAFADRSKQSAKRRFPVVLPVPRQAGGGRPDAGGLRDGGRGPGPLLPGDEAERVHRRHAGGPQGPPLHPHHAEDRRGARRDGLLLRHGARRRRVALR